MSNIEVTRANVEFWWWYFPITGLSITDETPDLEHPLFKDASIISVAAMKSLIQNDPSHPQDLKNFAEDLFEKEADSVLAIKQALFTTDGEMETLRAQEKCAEIMSGLLLFALSEHGLKFGYGPSDLISHKASVYVSIRDDGQRSVHRYSRSQTILFGRQNGTYSRTDFKRKIEISRLSPLLKAIFESDSHLHASVRNAVLSATRRHATACYMNSPGDIVASSTTCFELFLKEDEVAADTVVQARLEALIGLPKRQVMRLYKCRNSWVHQGVPPMEKAVTDALVFVPEALLELINMAYLAPPQTSLKGLVQYFDLCALIERSDEARPGELEQLFHHFKDLDPFRTAERKHRKYNATIYILNDELAVSPNWFYSKKVRKSLPCLPLIEFSPKNAKDVTKALKTILYEQDKDFDDSEGHPIKLERNNRFSPIAGCTSIRDLRKNSLMVEIAHADDYELAITLRDAPDQTQPQLMKVDAEDGLSFVSRQIMALADSLKPATSDQTEVQDCTSG